MVVLTFTEQEIIRGKVYIKTYEQDYISGVKTLISKVLVSVEEK